MYKGVGDGGGWLVGGGLQLATGLFGVQKVLVIGPDMPRGPKRCLTNTGVNVRPIPLI